MAENTAPATMATATGLKAFNSMIQSPKTQNYLQDVLGEKKSEFVNNVVALVANSELLQQCENQSVLYAAINATALNLPLDKNLGFAYVIPYWDNKNRVQKAQFQIGKNGLLQLAIRSGQIAKINVTDVREGELVDEDILTGDIKLKRISGRESQKVIGYCAYMELKNGLKHTVYSTREEIEAHALRFTKQKKDGKLGGVWASDFDAMAKKTVLKAVLKYAPMSTEMQRAEKAESMPDDASPVPDLSANYQEAEVITMEAEPPQPEQTQTEPPHKAKTEIDF